MTAWSTCCTHDFDAPVTSIWSVLADTSTWKDWNPGVKSIRIDGPFASGTGFAMELPDGTVIDSTLVSVVAPQTFTDQSCFGETLIQVEHHVEALTGQKSRVTYALRAQGPDAQVIGEAASEYFPSVLQGLADYLARKTQKEHPLP